MTLGGGGGGRGGRGGEEASASPWRSSWFSPRTRFCTFCGCGQVLTALRGAGARSAPRRKSDVGLVVPFSDVIISLALSHLETWTLFLRAPCSGRHLPSCACDSLWRVWEEFPAVFYVKLHTNPEVDLPFALENLDFSACPLYLAVTRTGRVSLRLLDEFHAFSP